VAVRSEPAGIAMTTRTRLAVALPWLALPTVAAAGAITATVALALC
jgi:hypothetical protein